MGQFSRGDAANWSEAAVLCRGGRQPHISPGQRFTRLHLASSYSGPYRVLQREKKIFLLQLGDRQEWISADR